MEQFDDVIDDVSFDRLASYTSIQMNSAFAICFLTDMNKPIVLELSKPTKLCRTMASGPPIDGALPSQPGMAFTQQQTSNAVSQYSFIPASSSTPRVETPAATTAATTDANAPSASSSASSVTDALQYMPTCTYMATKSITLYRQPCSREPTVVARQQRSGGFRCASCFIFSSTTRSGPT
jgi:hypothetical protein